MTVNPAMNTRGKQANTSMNTWFSMTTESTAPMETDSRAVR